ncbi:Rad4-domain-containing protein, partial [Tilletiaria anomala UBC 951]
MPDNNAGQNGKAGEEEEEEMEFEQVEIPEQARAPASTKAAQFSATMKAEDEEEMEAVGVDYENDEMVEVGENSDGEDILAEVDEDGDDDEADEAAAAYANLYGEDGAAPKSTKSKHPASANSNRSKVQGKNAALRVYFDGKGQHAGVTISLDYQSSLQRKRKREADAEEERRRQRRENMITPRDRQNRIVAHKLHVLALLAWAKGRNAMLQDDELQAWLSDQAPKNLIEKQKRITPRKEPNQRERVRLFESFLTQLTEWWKGQFRLDSTMVAGAAIRQPDIDLVNGSGITFGKTGRRVDGWVYESAAQRVDRQKGEKEATQKWQDRQAKSIKGKGKANDDPKGKGKQEAKSSSGQGGQGDGAKPLEKTPEISIFPPGAVSHTKLPAYLRLAKPVERISNASDLLDRAMEMRGSRETSASLFAGLCRALGIPARLVISPQVPPWSVAAAKVSKSGGNAVGDMSTNAGGTASATANASTAAKVRKPGSEAMRRLPSDEATSDDDKQAATYLRADEDASSASKIRAKGSVSTRIPQVANGANVASSGSCALATTTLSHQFLGGVRSATARAAEKAQDAATHTHGTIYRVNAKGKGKGRVDGADKNGSDSVSVISLSDSRASSVDVVWNGAGLSAKPGAKTSVKRSTESGSGRLFDDEDDEKSVITVHSDASSAAIKARRKGKGTSGAAVLKEGKARQADAEAEENDYRDEKWRGLTAPLKVTPTVKLRPHSRRHAKTGHVVAEGDGELEPVNLQYPPTVWVEAFSKPFQKWLTVDPIRGFVFATGNRYMEPVAADRQNKLVYVVAYEEDGYARDVTARYTRTLHSRIARMRPPPSKAHGDWWESVVRAISRPFKLDRDAVEDVELEDNASKEPMPSSVAGFKDHPVYVIEKHLKRDEVIFPPTSAGTFQNTPVYLRSNVLTCRSARQWMNEGRVIKENEQPLKLVKSRAYTIGNKRVEEQARAQGQQLPQEGLYARFQTKIYRPPPIVDGKIPTNSFGNIDLYVPSMLPKGAAHIPFNGSAKVAKKLGIPFAEAVVGFEFRKFKGMPKMGGIVVLVEHEE